MLNSKISGSQGPDRRGGLARGGDPCNDLYRPRRCFRRRAWLRRPAPRAGRTQGLLPLAEFKHKLREQFFMLLLDEEGAVNAIPAMLPKILRKSRSGSRSYGRSYWPPASRARSGAGASPASPAFRGRGSETRGRRSGRRERPLDLDHAAISGGILMSKETIENRTFAEIAIGDCATLTRTLSEQDISLFAAASGDINPTHLDSEYMKKSGRGGVVGHSPGAGRSSRASSETSCRGPARFTGARTFNFSAVLWRHGHPHHYE